MHSIPNPDYKGPWTPKRIPNPDYKGPWIHPEIDNPDYKYDSEIYAYDFANLGIDLWQVKSGTSFDNILITDDITEAERVRNESLELAKKEKDAKKAYDEAQNKKKEEEAAAAAATEEEKVDESDEEITINLDDEAPAAAEEKKDKKEEEDHIKDEL